MKIKKTNVFLLLSTVIIFVFILNYFLKLNNLNAKVDILLEQNSELKALMFDSNTSVNASKNCRFTRTYRIVTTLQYPDTTNEYNYYVVDQFQSAIPNLIKLKKDTASTIDKDRYYEITLAGDATKVDINNTADVFNNFIVENVELTNKQGLEQIQENQCN